MAASPHLFDQRPTSVPRAPVTTIFAIRSPTAPVLSLLTLVASREDWCLARASSPGASVGLGAQEDGEESGHYDECGNDHRSERDEFQYGD